MRCDTCKWLESTDTRSGWINCGGWDVFVANNMRHERKTGARFGQPLADFVECSHYVKK